MIDNEKLVKLLQDAEYGLSALTRETLSIGNEAWLAEVKARIAEAVAQLHGPADHTPGPWGWEHDGGMNPSMPYRIVRQTVEPRATTARRPYHALAQTQADAELIAAAPLLQRSRELIEKERDELRKAHDELRAVLEGVSHWCHYGHGGHPATSCGLCKPVVEVLQKVRGV